MHAGLVVENILHVATRDVLMVREIVDESGVDVATAGHHGDSREWGETHGGVDGCTISDGGDGAAAAEVADDDFFWDFCERVEDVLADDAVEAVFF